jgi:hypothetical protein
VLLNHEGVKMDRFSWQPQRRHAAIARPLVIAAVAMLVLAVVAAAGMAARNRVSIAPTNTQPPVVSGTPQVGKELTTTNGTWSGTTPLSFSYQWRRCDETGGSCSDISGATSNTYALKSVDSANTLRVVVTAKNADGTDHATSVPTGLITAAAPPPAAGNGCPAAKSGTAPIAELSPPARLQIEAFRVTTGAINKSTQSFSLQVRVGSTCGVGIQGASVYVTAVPYNQFNVPAEPVTGSDGTVTLSFSRLSGFPASSKQQQLTLFIRATKAGEDPLAGVSTRRLVAVNFSS